MKKIVIFTLIMITSFSMKSQSLIAKTEDGRRVILNKDKSWEFIDNKPVNESLQKTNNCKLTEGFKEPKSEKNLYNWLKKVGATTDDLKKHVSVDNDCEINDVVILKISEQMGNAVYILCVKGLEMKYKRIGSAFFKADEDPLSRK